MEKNKIIAFFGLAFGGGMTYLVLSDLFNLHNAVTSGIAGSIIVGVFLLKN